MPGMGTRADVRAGTVACIPAAEAVQLVTEATRMYEVSVL